VLIRSILLRGGANAERDTGNTELLSVFPKGWAAVNLRKPIARGPKLSGLDLSDLDLSDLDLSDLDLSDLDLSDLELSDLELPLRLAHPQRKDNFCPLKHK
jgi:uncharacterized protein YjbI with pentapeptide repeats